MTEKVLVPDVGDAEEVTVVEVLVSVGDAVEKESPVVVLESDKASMEIPSPVAGRVNAISVAEGDVVNEGDLILELDVQDESQESDHEETEVKASADEPAESDSAEPRKDTESEARATRDTGNKQTSRTIRVPDVGDAKEVIVVEILVKEGDRVDAEDSIVVLESDKASMDVPAGVGGTITKVLISENQEVKEGDSLLTMDVEVDEADEIEAAGEKPEAADREEPKRPEESQEASAAPSRESEDESPVVPGGKVHAGPAVRKQAREYGVDLSEVKGTGRKGRILKEDVQKYVKDRLSKATRTGIPGIPAVDFSKYGDVDVQALSRVRKMSARNLHRSWLNVPHVTQFDEADITDLEDFRKSWNEEHKDQGVKVTLLAFLVKICVDALIQYPRFNASLDEKIENLILKQYYNIGIAVDTEDGLVVPVIKDADNKGVEQLAKETAELAAMARDKKLPLDAMQGATFTISSLGGIGGTAFTPIVNAPEVAILGVSRARVSPVFDGQAFKPRTMLPLSLSYDHRAIDGAEAVRFTTWLASALTDVQRLLM